MRAYLIAAAIIAGMGTSANAAAMQSAPAYGGPTQANIVCYYSNLGPNPVSITSSTILVEPGNAVTEISESCTGTIPAGSRCRTVSGPIVTNGAHWCRIVVDNKAPVRGRAEYRNSSGAVLTWETIR